MIHKLYYLFLACALIFFNSLSAAPLQFENMLIEKINIEILNLPSNDTFDATKVTAMMKTRQGGVFSQNDFDNDLKMLVTEFDNVEPCIAVAEGKLYISLKIWPKPTIRSYQWKGVHKVSTKTLLSELGIPVCSVFDRQAFNKAFHKLKDYYVKQGFFEAELDYIIDLDPTTNTVDVTVEVCEGRAGRIKKIQFVNFTDCEEEAILEDMVTKPYNIFLSWYTGEGTYHEDAMQQDRFTILNYLHNHGYSDATVDIDITECTQNNRIIITITACKGEPYFFGPITFEGNTLLCDEEIESRFLIKEKRRYSPEAIRDTIKKITDAYGRRGYIDAIVDYEARLDCATRTYSLDLSIEEGEQYRVGLIKIFGNDTTESTVILHETLLIPGEIFNIIKLQLTEERLKNIGYFKHVNVYAVRSDGPGGLGGHYRDVHIEVEEDMTGNFGAGAGVSNGEGMFGEFKITERNFNHKGLFSCWKEGCQTLRGGGEYLSLTALYGVKTSKYTLAWTKPYFRDTKWVVGFDLSYSTNKYISNYYDIHATNFTINGAYPLNSFLTFGTHYRFTNSFVTLDNHEIHKHEREINAEIARVKEEKATTPEEKHHKEEKLNHLNHQLDGLDQGLEKAAKNLGVISAIGTTLTYNTTNSPVFPSRGFKSSLEQELAGFGGDHTFMSLAYLNNYYIPVEDRGVFKFRADMRFIVPLFDTKRSHIPIDERLFLGGENTVRGFKTYRIGPQFNTGDPKGGLSMQLLSVEYTYLLGSRASVFIFCDSGHLSYDIWNFGRMWTSVGFGINLSVLGPNTPPVTLGLGFPVNSNKSSEVKHFFFNIGGRF